MPRNDQEGADYAKTFLGIFKGNCTKEDLDGILCQTKISATICIFSRPPASSHEVFQEKFCRLLFWKRL